MTKPHFYTVNKYYTRTVWPTSEPVIDTDGLAFAKRDEGDAALMASALKVARERVEDFTGRSIVPQTWVMTADAWPSGNGIRARTIVLDRSPLVSVTSVKYWPAVGSVQATLDTDMYYQPRPNEPGSVVLNYGEQWPDLADRPDAVEVTFVAGYSDETKIPERLLQAIKLIAAGELDFPVEQVTGTIVAQIPNRLENLLIPLRVGGWSA